MVAQYSAGSALSPGFGKLTPCSRFLVYTRFCCYLFAAETSLVPYELASDRLEQIPELYTC